MAAAFLAARFPRLFAWLRTTPVEPSPVEITGRRIYILPTRHGVLFGVFLAAMLVGAVNYGLSLGFALVFLLAGVGLITLFYTWRNLRGITVHALGATPTFAGEAAWFHLALSAATPRPAIELIPPGGSPLRVDVNGLTPASLAIAAPARGRLTLPRLILATDYPLGLFRAWAIVRPDLATLVYPRPLDTARLEHAPAAPDSGSPEAQAGPQGHEVFAGLRAFVPGDSPRRVAWKVLARGGPLLAKEFFDTAGGVIWLDWQDAPGEPETRLAWLTRAVLTAEAQGVRYGLRLPGRTLAPDRGPGHRQACLSLLATFGEAKACPDSRRTRATPQSPASPLPRRSILVLTAGLTWVLAPLALHLPLWVTLAAAALITWRTLATLGFWPLAGKRLLLLLAAAGAAAILAAYHTLFGREAGVAMLTLMTALKLMEMRSRRDGVLAVFLGLFVLLTQFLYGQGIVEALIALTATGFLLAGLALLTHPGHSGRGAARLSVLLMLSALPVMVVLFLLFPRPLGPLWGLPRDARAGMSGLDETMSPGSISRLIQSDQVAFRVEFAGPLPPPAQRYWRGPVLERFDGRSWLPDRSPAPEPTVESAGEAIAYTLTLEPHGKNWIFALDVPDPLALPPHTRLSPTLQLLAEKPVEHRRRFALVALPRYRLDANADTSLLTKALALPEKGNPRARALAQTLSARAHSEEEVVAAALQLFRSQPFHYTLTPPLLGEDGVDEFLFETRRGFCEHYAGAFTFLMRAAGVPARVVTGYQGGEFNPLGGYFIVRQSDAHAWSEVWLAGRGWVRVDPTAAVAAERIERGVAAALPAAEPLPFLMRTEVRWLRTLRLQWDLLNTRWHQWVIGFDQERQLALLARMGAGIVSWRELAWMLAASLGALALLFAAITLRRPTPTDPLQAIWQRFCRRLAAAGLPRAPHEGPLAYARRIARLRPDLAAPIEAIANAYATLRYGPRINREALASLRRQVAKFRVRGGVKRQLSSL
jgi:transglutaminase-like putative cysteine protease/uncharacterized protein (DUF58 family)